MLWVLAGVDAAAGAYLLGWALRRERRDKPAVLAVGVMLLACAVVIAGLGLVVAGDEAPPPVSPEGGSGVVV